MRELFFTYWNCSKQYLIHAVLAAGLFWAGAAEGFSVSPSGPDGGLDTYELFLSHLSGPDCEQVHAALDELGVSWKRSSVLDTLLIHATETDTDTLREALSEKGINVPIYIQQSGSPMLFSQASLLTPFQSTSGIPIAEALAKMQIPVFTESPKIGILADGIIDDDYFEDNLKTPEIDLDDLTKGKGGSVIYRILKEIIPNAKFYFYPVTTADNILKAFDDPAVRNMDILINTLTFAGLGPENTSSTTNAKIKQMAEKHNLRVIQAAGDYGNTHFAMKYKDVNADSAYDFPQGDVLRFSLPASIGVQIVLIWEDSWDAARHDLNLRIYKLSNNGLFEFVTKSSNVQNGQAGSIPYEIVKINPPASKTQYTLEIINANSTDKTNMGMHMYFMPLSSLAVYESPSFLTDPAKALFESNEIEFIQSTSSSIPSLADISTFLTVGSINGSNLIRSYSSRGPVYYNNAVKPDLVAYDGIYIDEKFRNVLGSGVSAAFAAAVAAHYVGLDPDITMEDLKNEFADNNTIPLPSAENPDLNTYGHGKLHYGGVLPTPTPTATPTATGTPGPTATPTKTPTPTGTPIPTFTPMPTPTPFTVPVDSVVVTDDENSFVDLAGSYDQDADDDKALTIHWNTDQEGITDYHIYVLKNDAKEPKYLGRTGSADVHIFNWKVGTKFPGGSVTEGPEFGNSYWFMVAGIITNAPPIYIKATAPVLFLSNDAVPPTPTHTPTLTPTPTYTPTPTPTYVSIEVPVDTVMVTDDPYSTEDLAGLIDYDPEEDRALTIRWNMAHEGITDYHIYVQVNDVKPAQYLGRTGSGDVHIFNWKVGTKFPGGSVTEGPEFGNNYYFIVSGILEDGKYESIFAEGPVQFLSKDDEPTPIPTFTPTATPTETHTPTSTPTEAPSPTPTITPIPTITPPDTPTPMETPTPTATQTSTATPVPDYSIKSYEFDKWNLDDCEWQEHPGFLIPPPPLGTIETSKSVMQYIPSSKDKTGISLKVQSGELIFLHTSTGVTIESDLILIRALVSAVYDNMQISVGALEGDLSSGESLDGSINYSTKMSSSEFLDHEGYIYAIIHTQKKIITPFIQVFNPDTNSNNGEPSVLLLDRIDVIEITDHWELKN